MRVAVDMTTGHLFLLHVSGAWRLDLSGGGIALVHVAERVIVDARTGQIAVIVLPPTNP